MSTLRWLTPAGSWLGVSWVKLRLITGFRWWQPDPSIVTLCILGTLWISSLPWTFHPMVSASIANHCLSQLFHWWLQYTVNSLKINNFNPPGLPQWFRSKESYCNAGNMGLVPGSGKISWRSTWQPTPVFLPGKSRRQRILVAAAHAVAQSRALLSGYSGADFGLNTVWEGTSNGAIPSKCGVYFLLVFFTEKVTCEIKMQTVKKETQWK